MKKFFLALFLSLIVTGNCFGQSCETTIDGNSVCDFKITDWYGLSSAPALSTVGAGRVYFDISSGKLKCSEDGNAYTNCVGSAGGSGTVTSVSVATANGFSGTVANATTTPAITIIAGAIVPTSVNGVTISGSSTPTLAVTGTTTVSGTNTGDQSLASAGGWTDGGTNVFLTTTSDVVGIGTTTPSASTTFEIVEQSSKAPLKISSSATGAGDFLTITSDGKVGIGTFSPLGGLSILNGNVGIGIANPSASLHVQGAGTANILMGGLPGFLDYAALSLNGSLATYNFLSGPGDGTLYINRRNGNSIIFYENGSLQQMTILGGGNVGIATANPGQVLDVNGTVRAGAGSTSTTSFNTTADNNTGVYFPAADNLGLVTGGVEAMRINANGNVGIGTVAPRGGLVVMNGNVGIGTWSPVADLHIVENNPNGGVRGIVLDQYISNTTGAATVWRKARGTSASPTAALSGDNLGFFGFRGFHSGGAFPTTSTVYMQATASENFTSSAQGGYLTIGTTPIGSATSAERLRIDSTGNIGIGTTTPGQILDVNGTVRAGAGTVLVAAFNTTADNNTGMYFPAADNIGLVTGGVEAVRVDANGNIGIGSISPVQKIDIAGTAQMTGFKLPTGAASGYLLTSNSVGIGTWTPPGSGGGSYTDAQAQAATGWVDGGTNVFNSTTSDNVGIGTTTPVATLTVENVGSGSSFRVNDAITDGSPFIIDAAGNVGVGTYLPSSKLDVEGLENDSGIDINAIGTESGIDSFTMLDLHGDGVDGSTSILDSSTFARTVSVFADAQIDTAQSKFGGASILLDGTGDYVSVPNSTDFQFGTGDFTIDCWLRFNSLSSVENIFAFSTTAGPWQFFWNNSDNTFNIYGATNTMLTSSVQSLSTGTWYHIAFVRAGDAWNIYKDGTSIAAVTDSRSVGLPNHVRNVGIGAEVTGPSQFFNGWIDEPRVSKGIARWTGPFTPPTTAYGAGAAPRIKFQRVGVTSVTMGIDASDSGKFKISKTSVSDNPYMTITTDGNIGIGTTNPRGALTVMNGNVGIGTWSPTGGLIVMNGNVGIGTGMPLNTLQINGTLQIDNAGNAGGSVQSSANQACNTTCKSGCMVGFDQGTLGVVLPSMVGCADATADQCFCMGPS